MMITDRHTHTDRIFSCPFPRWVDLSSGTLLGSNFVKLKHHIIWARPKSWCLCEGICKSCGVWRLGRRRRMTSKHGVLCFMVCAGYKPFEGLQVDYFGDWLIIFADGTLVRCKTLWRSVRSSKWDWFLKGNWRKTSFTVFFDEKLLLDNRWQHVGYLELHAIVAW